ncbi:MAG: NgoMIV family type II restriction endonuclease [Acidobacteriia bacterium]|nr:NgoMIV family type II restriction endonuclease [Terriglobia bacterium]
MQASETSLTLKARKSFHASLLSTGVLRIISRKNAKAGMATTYPSNADGDSAASIAIAQAIFDQIQSQPRGKVAGHISGNTFERTIRSFIKETFSALKSVRRGKGKSNKKAFFEHKFFESAKKSDELTILLVRARKGQAPHIAVVTGEPLPSRLADLALGTAGIDCVYHLALPELMKAVESLKIEDSWRLVRAMVDGKRLKDIAELPFDLAVTDDL